MLVTALKRERGDACCPTITFGGSCKLQPARRLACCALTRSGLASGTDGAELSFGLRAKYPWVFDAALVASGPLLTDIGDNICTPLPARTRPLAA